jgi:N-acetylglucosamine-6-phosphate deacetylase
MHFEGAPPGIKLALGENVKQSNWGDEHTTRYPQTRMGVETLIRDRFQAAREYARAREKAGDDPWTQPRRDLELEALAEILAGTRLVHCHSYRQDEILMLCRVAKDFGFRIGTFQHVLEGYKVAEAIRESAIGASAFSDWWAYKIEVQDAIPWNGAIMHREGIVVSFNSDSNDLARRMNVEAAKAVKYGGLDPHDALKFVTLNPAIQLGIEKRVGSIEADKDADLAIWNADPLSTFSRCVATWVDGREAFSLARDAELRRANEANRARLLKKLLALTPEKPDAPGGRRRRGDEHERRARLDLWRHGLDADGEGCGDCGVHGHGGGR